MQCARSLKLNQHFNCPFIPKSWLYIVTFIFKVNTQGPPFNFNTSATEHPKMKMAGAHEGGGTKKIDVILKT